MKKLFICLIFLFCSTSLTSCPFCDQNVIHDQAVFESEYFNIFLDHAPLVSGHLLIIPKRHVERADELLVEEWQEFSTLFPKAVEVFKQTLNTDRYLVLQKNGCSFQSQPHIHFHLIPVCSETWKDIFMRPIVPVIDSEVYEENVNRMRAAFEAINGNDS